MMEFDVSHVGLDEYSALLRGLPAKLRKPILRRTAQIAENMAGIQLRRATSTWQHNPMFNIKSRHTADSVSVQVSTGSEIYRYVDEGTRAHIIEPIGEGYPLRFQSGYQAKTIPNVLSSGPGGSSGNTVRAMRVRHPGTRARRISQGVMGAVRKTIQSTLGTLWRKAVKEAMGKR